MSSEKSLDYRLNLIYEVFLVVGQDKAIQRAQSPVQGEAYGLVKAIIYDQKYKCSNKTLFIKTLKKSPVWLKLLEFLENTDTKCRQKGCNCYKSSHNQAGICKGRHSHWNMNQIPHIHYTDCTCKQFIQKPL